MLTRNQLSTRDMLLITGDLVCILLFAVLGLRNHDEGITLDGVIRAATPFQAGWLTVIFAFGVRGRGELYDGRGVVRAWVPAWALGLVIRTVLFDHDLAPTFAMVALLVNGAFLLIWRGVFAPLLPR
jgi:hypothetical protein